MIRFLLFPLICISLNLGAAPQIDIDKYIQSDFLTKEIKLKDSLQSKKLQSLFVQKKRKFKYPSYNDFWSFTFEYWMVKNARYLKWDQAIDNDEIENEFRKIIKENKLGIKKFKIFILPTSWISHFALPKGNSEFYFFISQQFIKESQIDPSQASIVLLDEYLKLKNGYLMAFLKNADFVKNLGKDFYLNKNPDISSFEKLVGKISYFFRFYGYQFEHAFTNYQDIKSMDKKSIKTNAAKKDKLTSRFQKTYSLIYNSRQKLEKKFPRILGLYPSALLYQSWFQE